MKDLFKDALRVKLNEWVNTIPEPDKPIIGIGGGTALSPREILKHVNEETPLGQALAKNWAELAVEHVMNAKVLK